MRHIAALDDGKIPRDDDFNFRLRAKNLVDKWHQILNANKPPTGSPAASTSGQANGKLDQEVTKDKEEDAVTKATKNIDLNGSYWKLFTLLFVFLADIADVKLLPWLGDGHNEGNEEDAKADIGDASILADVTMSEAWFWSVMPRGCYVWSKVDAFAEVINVVRLCCSSFNPPNKPTSL